MARVLIGFMGAGKSTVGRLLSDQLYDMDDMLVERLGMPIKDYFAKEGEPAFRQQETALLEELLADPEAVISPGGGVVLSPENRQLLEGHEVIFLELDFDSLYDRISQDQGAERPLFLNNSREAFKAIFDSRQAIYKEAASLTIQVGDKTPEQVAEAILENSH